MCWIEVPNRVIREEVLARLEDHPQAISVTAARHAALRWTAFVLGFAAGVVVGWFWQIW